MSELNDLKKATDQHQILSGSQMKIASIALGSFYNKILTEIGENTPGIKQTEQQNVNSRDIRLWTEEVDKQTRYYQRNLAEKLHEYFRTAIIPRYNFPDNCYVATLELGELDGTISAGYRQICAHMHLWAGRYYDIDPSKYEFVDDPEEYGKEACSHLRVGMSDYEYVPTPPINHRYYSEDYAAAVEKKEELEEAVESLDKAVSTAESGLEFHKGNLFTGILAIIPKLIALIVVTIFETWYIYAGLSIAAIVLGMILPDGAGYIVGIILIIAFLIVLIKSMMENAGDIRPFKCFEDARMRKEYQKDLEKAQAERSREYDARKAVLNEYLASREYLDAKKENDRLEKEDKELAKRWQNAWKEDLRRNPPKWLIL